MSEKQDAEYFINKFVTVIKDNLNAKITAINTAKGDSLLTAVDSNAYYYLTFGQRIPAYDPAVIFGASVELEGDVRSEVTERLIIAIEMVISSKAEADPLQVMARVQRYRRAIAEVILENYRSFPNLEFDAIPDVGFVEANQFYYALGAVVKMVYTT